MKAVESKVASLTAQADASIAHITSVLSERVQQVAEHSDVQALCVAVEILQQLKRGLEVVATSAAAMLERQTRTAVEEVQNWIQAQIKQTRADQEMRNAEIQAAVGKIAIDLEELTRQLNAFKPASVESVEDTQKQYSEQLNARVNTKV